MIREEKKRKRKRKIPKETTSMTNEPAVNIEPTGLTPTKLDDNVITEEKDKTTELKPIIIEVHKTEAQRRFEQAQQKRVCRCIGYNQLIII